MLIVGQGVVMICACCLGGGCGREENASRRRLRPRRAVDARDRQQKSTPYSPARQPSPQTHGQTLAHIASQSNRPEPRWERRKTKAARSWRSRRTARAGGEEERGPAPARALALLGATTTVTATATVITITAAAPALVHARAPQPTAPASARPEAARAPTTTTLGCAPPASSCGGSSSSSSKAPLPSQAPVVPHAQPTRPSSTRKKTISAAAPNSAPGCRRRKACALTASRTTRRAPSLPNSARRGTPGSPKPRRGCTMRGRSSAWPGRNGRRTSGISRLGR